MDIEEALNLFRRRLETEGLTGSPVETFERMYRAYRAGASGKIAWERVEPPTADDLIELDALNRSGLASSGKAQLGRAVWVILNGGLGTSMKMDRAKSLVPVKGTKTFLDLIAEHVLELRRRWDRDFPILFMNSFTTRGDTLNALARYPLGISISHGRSLPLDFLQHRFPRVRERDGLPFSESADPGAWAPPGHGNLYSALHGSGLLTTLLDNGFRWAFVSNADNLGASPHPCILGYMVSERVEFLMEVTPRTAVDVKGGTLVRRSGRLELLEIAQVPEEHLAEFQNPNTFPVFNTNNLWVDLEALARRLSRGPLELPLIVNRKQVGPTPVVQFESAMGAAVGAFSHSGGILVSRSRFAPVKTTDDLLVRRSDAYVRGGESPIVPNPGRSPSFGPPRVRLDPEFYGAVPDLDLRIPDPPSLLRAASLLIQGDVRFGQRVTVVGEVEVRNLGSQAVYIEDDTVLSG